MTGGEIPVASAMNRTNMTGGEIPVAERISGPSSIRMHTNDSGAFANEKQVRVPAE